MKFLPIREFDDITTALNFSTPDCHVVGNVDLYTTKAAGSDKKLYKDIENSLESQYESLLKLSASLSPPQQTGFSPLDLSRSSPFGPLSQISSRRTFAYLIATLNASHPDYDFSHVLRPKDFKREKSLRSVINNIDSTLYNLRPAQKVAFESPRYQDGSQSSGAVGGSQTWGPKMWALIDKEMSLKDCSVYCWAPTESVWEGEEGAIWTLNYFFFNKMRKRVAYFYARGIPVMTHSPRLVGRRGSKAQNDEGASKRASYWLGDKAANARGLGDEDDDNDLPMALDDDEEFDLNDVSDDYTSDMLDDDMYDGMDDDDDDDISPSRRVRGISEEVADKMEL